METPAPDDSVDIIDNEEGKTDTCAAVEETAGSDPSSDATALGEEHKTILEETKTETKTMLMGRKPSVVESNPASSVHFLPVVGLLGVVWHAHGTNALPIVPRQPQLEEVNLLEVSFLIITTTPTIQ